MAFCRKCGKQIDNEAVICPHCGVPQQDLQQAAKPAEDNRKATGIEIAGSILIPIIGIILGIAYYASGKKKAGSTLLAAGLIASTVFGLIISISASL